jgi:hypothetical protein
MSLGGQRVPAKGMVWHKTLKTNGEDFVHFHDSKARRDSEGSCPPGLFKETETDAGCHKVIYQEASDISQMARFLRAFTLDLIPGIQDIAGDKPHLITHAQMCDAALF